MHSLRAAAFASILIAAGCGSRPFRGEEAAPHAVVLSLASQDRASERLARALNERGYDVVRASTTIARDRTSVSVYDVRRRPERIEEVARILKDVGLTSVEILPFQQHATGGNVVVAWLGADVADEATK